MALAAGALGACTGTRWQLRTLSLPLEGRHHDGADDAWNIAALILHLHARSAWP